jgi:uncharacterized protein (TIGR00251 family)
VVEFALAVPSVRSGPSGLLVGVRVNPSALRTALRGVYGDRLKVSVTAPPEDGRANQELTEALARWLELRRDSVRVAAGHGSRDKVVAITGIEEPELRNKLIGLLRGDSPRRGE